MLHERVAGIQLGIVVAFRKRRHSLVTARFERCKAKRDAAIWSHAYRALQLTSAVRHSLDFSGLVLSQILIHIAQAVGLAKAAMHEVRLWHFSDLP
jgi:hypothetical protein